jgi:hypothetical protein
LGISFCPREIKIEKGKLVMQTKEFVELLEEENIEYKINDEKIIVTSRNVHLNLLESLPKGIEFNNGGYVGLASLKSIPKGTRFNNGGDIYLDSLESLPKGIGFNNGGGIYLDSLESLPKGIEFNNGGYISLDSLESLPKGTKFNSGGHVYLKHKTIKSSKPYLERQKVRIKDGSVILYKRVSKYFKTQEDTENETLWEVGATLTHDNWEPDKDECGAGKFHACARAGWCDRFRSENGDKYVAIEVKVDDLYEWPEVQIFPQEIAFRNFPQKIAFRKGKVLHECDRRGNRLLHEQAA